MKRSFWQITFFFIHEVTLSLSLFFKRHYMFSSNRCISFKMFYMSYFHLWKQIYKQNNPNKSWYQNPYNECWMVPITWKKKITDVRFNNHWEFLMKCPLLLSLPALFYFLLFLSIQTWRFWPWIPAHISHWKFFKNPMGKRASGLCYL